MSNEAKNKLPPHLMDLLQPTPSGATKLIAAWDGLSAESQMQLLTALDEAKFPPYLVQNIRRKALDSSNAYVRYLAAREFCFSEDDNEEEKALKDKIEMDSDPLVKYCLLESKWSLSDEVIKNPELFFNLPHEARLAKVRQYDSSGEAIASLVSYAVDNCLEQGQVSEIELYEILADYLNKPSFHKRYKEDGFSRYSDGYGEYQKGKDIEALWALVPKGSDWISSVLLEHLPEEAGLGSGIPDGILGQLKPWQLGQLLYRRDIVLKEFRLEIFKKPAERFDEVRCAAISSNFDLSYDEFSEILEKSDNEKMDILCDLSSMAGDLSLVFYEASHDILSTVNDSLESFSLDSAEMDAEVAFERKAKNLAGWQRERQLRELRLYRLAKSVAPWKVATEGYPPKGYLDFLANLTVNGDTWTTFKNYSNEWDKRGNVELEKLLPRIYEVGEEDIEEEFDNNLDIDEDIVDRVEKRVADVLNSLSGEDEEKDKSLMEALGKLTAHATSFQERVSESIRNLKKDVSDLQAYVAKQMILLYLVIGLLVWLLIVVN